MSKTTDFLIWKDNSGIHVECSNCGYQLSDTEPIPDVCPNCKKSVDTVSMPILDAMRLMPSLEHFKGFKN